MQICEFSDSKQALGYLLEHCSTLLKIENVAEKTFNEEFTPKDIKRTALYFDAAVKAKRKAEVEKQPTCHCPELFSDLLQFITEKESNESLASSIAKLPYVQPKAVVAGAADETEKNVDDANHLSQLKEFVKHINTAGNLRGRLVLLKFLLTILELSPEVKSTYERTLTGDGAEDNSSLVSNRFPESTLQEFRKSNLIGRKDISKILDIMNEKDRLQIFDCHPRLILKSGNPSKLRALEVRGAVTGFIGGVFVRPNRGFSYFEVTLKGCSLEALGVRIGWGLSGVEVDDDDSQNERRNVKNEVHDLPGDYGECWTFDGSSGGHYFHNAKALRDLRANEVKLQAIDSKERTNEHVQKSSPQSPGKIPASEMHHTEVKSLETSVVHPPTPKNPVSSISDTRNIPDAAADVINDTAKEGSSTTASASVPSQLVVSVPAPAADYCAISAALASMDKQIADIDFSALLNVVRSNAAVTPPVPVQAALSGSEGVTERTPDRAPDRAPEGFSERVQEGVSDPLNDTPDFDFVDYTKSLTTTDTFDLLVDSQSNSPSGRANSSLFQANTENIPAEVSSELEGIEGPVLDYAKVFIKMLKVGIDINTISTTSTRSAIHALLTHENISDEAINDFIIEQKARDLGGANAAEGALMTNDIPAVVETDASSRGITAVSVEDDVLKSKASEERSRECALASGGVALTGSSEESADDSAQYQPFPPFPSMPDSDPSLALSSASNGKPVWCAGTVIGSLLNTHTGAISFFVNGKRIGSEINIGMGTYRTHAYPVFSCTSAAGLDFNIGQVPFAFEPAISVSAAKNKPMVCLASLFDTYPTPSPSPSNPSTSTSSGGSLTQSGKYDSTGIEESGLNREERESGGGELVNDKEEEKENDEKEEEKRKEKEKMEEELLSVCSTVFSSLRSPFFRLGSFQPSLLPSSKYGVHSYDEGPKSADLEEALNIDDDRVLSEMADIVDQDVISLQYREKDTVESTNIILINDDMPNFVYQGVSVETSVRLLPNAFYGNSLKSVNSNVTRAMTATTDLKGNSMIVNGSAKRVICSFILKADGRTVECSLTVQEDYSVQFSIKDFPHTTGTCGANENDNTNEMKNEIGLKKESGNGNESKDAKTDSKSFTYSTVSNTVLPLVWVNVSIVISNPSHSNNRDQGTTKCNISIFVNKYCAASFFCPYLNSLLESSSCEVGKIALGGYLSSIQKRRQSKLSKNIYSDTFVSLLESEDDEEKDVSKDNDANREEKDEKDAKEEKEGEEGDSIDLTGTVPYTPPVYRIKLGSRTSNWIGDICEFRFWVVPRSAETIFNSLGRSRVLGVEADLVVCLAFQEGVGSTLHDSTVLECVRSRDSIVVLHDTEEHSSDSSATSNSKTLGNSLGKNVLSSESLWGFQVSHKTFAAKRNLRSIEEHSSACSKVKTQSLTKLKKSEDFGSENPFFSGSGNDALSSFVFILLEGIGEMFLRISENYLDADSGDPKVSQ